MKNVNEELEGHSPRWDGERWIEPDESEDVGDGYERFNKEQRDTETINAVIDEMVANGELVQTDASNLSKVESDTVKTSTENLADNATNETRGVWDERIKTWIRPSGTVKQCRRPMFQPFKNP